MDGQILEITKIIAQLLCIVFTAIFTYLLTARSKRLDRITQNKIDAFKELNTVLVQFKIHCTGEISEIEGNEFGPMNESNISSFETRSRLYTLMETHSIFLNAKSRKGLDNFIGELSILCNIELYKAGGTLDNDINTIPAYEQFYKKAEALNDLLYKDLNS